MSSRRGGSSSATLGPRLPDAAELAARPRRGTRVPVTRPGAGVPGTRAARTGRVPGATEVGERAERLARRLSRNARSRVRPPGVSVGTGRVRGRPRPSPVVSVPDVRLYEDAVCVDTPGSHVHIGRCRVAGRAPDRPVPTPAQQRVRHVVTPTPTPTPTPTVATPTPQARIRAERPALPQRPNPLGTVLLVVVLSTVIAATTAVAFGGVK
ncbi:hypothetical protein [Nonomuraea sp. NPDC048826]|uniref:hypothetical protein n=1 Tax=Nonomuraea sp. NPDC048826 TaxID=3364347 RepID=UPI003712CD38